MRFCLVAGLALLIPAEFSAGGDAKKKEASSQIRLKETGNKSGLKNEKGRVFHAEFEFELEQMTGEDTVIGATTVPGKKFQRIHTTVEIPDEKSLTWKGLIDGGLINERGNEGTRQDGDCSCSIKVDSVDNAEVRLVASIKDTLTYTFSNGSTRSRSVRLQAAKTVKLGEKFKLDLAGENVLGIKSTCQGLIEEKAQQKK